MTISGVVVVDDVADEVVAGRRVTISINTLSAAPFTTLPLIAVSSFTTSVKTSFSGFVLTSFPKHGNVKLDTEFFTT